MRHLLTSTALVTTLALSLSACGAAVLDADVQGGATVEPVVAPDNGAVVVNSAESSGGGYVAPPPPPPPPVQDTQGAVEVNAAPGDVQQDRGAVEVNARP